MQITQSNKVSSFNEIINHFHDRYEDVTDIIEQADWLADNDAPPELIAKFEAEFGPAIQAARNLEPFKLYEFILYFLVFLLQPILQMLLSSFFMFAVIKTIIEIKPTPADSDILVMCLGLTLGFYVAQYVVNKLQE